MEQLAMFAPPGPAPFVATHVYVGDRLAKAESAYAGKGCMRAGPWRAGKAMMRFADGKLVVVLAGNGMIRKADNSLTS